MEKDYVIISSCLLGLECRYDGKSKGIDKKVIEKLKNKYNLIPVCPEQMGGLQTPRVKVELKDGKAINFNGEDVTENFKNGAEEVLKLVRIFDCKHAILKSKSPSCGFGQIYDGTFNGKLIDGNGITAQLLYDNGIKIKALF